MCFRLLPGFLLLLAACGGGGGSKVFGRLGGTLIVPAAQPQLAASMAQAEPFADSGSVDGMRVLRLVASRDRTLAVAVEGDVSACLYSLDTGRCGGSLEVTTGEVVDLIVEGRGRFRVSGEGSGEGGEIPEEYWCADDCRDGEIVVTPAPGWSAARIAAYAGLECVEESPGLCLLRARSSDGGLRKLLARCARLKEAGLVRVAEPNYERKLCSVPNDPFFDQQWSLEQIRIRGLWDEGGENAEAIIAVVDTGVATDHPEFAGRLVGGWDFIDDDDDPTDTTESQSHGTMVAGIAGAATDNRTGVAGIARSGRIMPLRVFGASGTANVFGIAQAIRFAAGLDNTSGRLPAQRAHVVNLSFAGLVKTRSEEEACAAARAAGTLPVAAAGNNSSSSPRYPAAYSTVLGVGATTRQGDLAFYSNRGSWLSLVAPGGTRTDGILVPDRTADGSFVYRRTNGTSFASPHVAGVAAVLMELGTLDPGEVQALLEGTARDVGEPGKDDETGWGIVDAHGAALALLNLPAPAVFPGEVMTVRLVDADDGVVIVSTTTTDGSGFAWSFDLVPPGRYRLIAGTDRDFDGGIDDHGELYGEWGDGADLPIDGGDVRTNLSVTVQPR
ncbi:MAG: S8 family serine peptidase [Planctomycetota bacterium]|jgi:subtilisin family serine protease